jgi:hypothetical protein
MSIVSEILKGAEEGAAGPVSIVGNLVSFGQTLIDRVWPDKDKQAQERAAAQAHLQELADAHAAAQLAALQAVDAAQSNTNAIEASSASLFKSGWRPAIGWVCAGALVLNYWPRAIAGVTLWVIQCAHTGTLAQYPDLGIADLLGLTASLLGMSTLRSVEIQKGVR